MWPYLYCSWVIGRFLKGSVTVTWHFRGSWDSVRLVCRYFTGP